MVFTIKEIKNWLTHQKSITTAINNLTEQSIIDCIPVDDFNSLNFVKNNETLKKYEAFIGMTRRKEEQLTIYRNTCGAEGRYWMACSPKWIEDEKQKRRMNTKYEIGYWVNYGDNSTYGWFTVEQIQEWFDNPKIFLHELGGTKER